jgi:hypothetical protein
MITFPTDLVAHADVAIADGLKDLMVAAGQAKTAEEVEHLLGLVRGFHHAFEVLEEAIWQREKSFYEVSR